jgi:hypothetical protein
MKQYQPLKAGDVRRLDDEYRQLWNHQLGLMPNNSTQPPNPGDWHFVNLVGETILRGDLINAEFRRPI